MSSRIESSRVDLVNGLKHFRFIYAIVKQTSSPFKNMYNKKERMVDSSSSGSLCFCIDCSNRHPEANCIAQFSSLRYSFYQSWSMSSFADSLIDYKTWTFDRCCRYKMIVPVMMIYN